MFIREIISEGEVIQGNFPNNNSPTENFNIHVFMSPAPGVQPDWFPSKPEVIKDQYLDMTTENDRAFYQYLLGNIID